MTTSKLKWLDLFSGGGMYTLGLEQAGHEVIGSCEVDKFCHKILKKHWSMKPISWSIESLNKALMESSEAFRARTFPSPVKKQGYRGMPPEMPLPVLDSSGRWLKPFAWYDLNTGSWRTWQSCLMDTWEAFSKRWPPAGMMRNGIAWEREPLASPTIAPGHTFLPTIAAMDGKGSSRIRYHGSPKQKRGRMSDVLRTSPNDPPCTHPNFAEAIMGLPKDYTLLETETPPALSENLQKD